MSCVHFSTTNIDFIYYAFNLLCTVYKTFVYVVYTLPFIVIVHHTGILNNYCCITGRYRYTTTHVIDRQVEKHKNINFPSPC